MSEPETERRLDGGMIQIIAARLDSLHEDMGDMKETLKDLATAIVKLALVEERQGQFVQAQERIFAAIDKLETRILVLELAKPEADRVSRWFERGLWAAVVAVSVMIWDSTKRP